MPKSKTRKEKLKEVARVRRQESQSRILQKLARKVAALETEIKEIKEDTNG